MLRIKLLERDLASANHRLDELEKQKWVSVAELNQALKHFATDSDVAVLFNKLHKLITNLSCQRSQNYVRPVYTGRKN